MSGQLGVRFADVMLEQVGLNPLQLVSKLLERLSLFLRRRVELVFVEFGSQMGLDGRLERLPQMIWAWTIKLI